MKPTNVKNTIHHHLIFWSSVFDALTMVGFWMLTTPGCSHKGPLSPMTAEESGQEGHLRAHVAMLELARLFRNEKPARSVRFAAFVNEEPPFFRTELMGSRVFAVEAAKNKEKVVAMLALESIGYYSEAPGSQQYPFPLSVFYPDTGDFVGFVGNFASRSLLRRCIRTFRETTPFPSEGVVAPQFITGIGWSDHWSFWQEGYPGLMVTDTAPFCNPHYHEPTDTPDRLDYGRMARLVSGLRKVLTEVSR